MTQSGHVPTNPPVTHRLGPFPVRVARAALALLEALAGDLAGVEGEEPSVVEREDGSLLIDGMMPAGDAFDRLGVAPAEGGFHTIAGFVLSRLEHLPVLGEHFDYGDWRFEVVDLDGRRIDKVLAIPLTTIRSTN